MSKLKKLIKTPGLYFRDYLNKKYGNPQKEKKAQPSSEKTQLISCAILEFLGFIDIKYIVHTGEGLDFGKNHLNGWMPEFSKIRSKTVILVRNEDLYKYVRKTWPNIICCYAKGVNEVTTVLTKLHNAKTIFYLSNTGNLIHSLRRNDFNHIFLGHGDSNKFASAHKFFRVYDEIWVAGQAHIDRFKNAGFDTKHIIFKKIGRPNLQKIIEENKDIDWTKRETRLAVVAPTWEGVTEENNGSSIKHLLEITKILLEYGFLVRIKLHPTTGKRDKSNLIIEKDLIELSRENSNLEIIPKEKPLTSILEKPTICIGDNSATITEFLSCFCPIVIYKPENDIQCSDSDMPYNEFCYEWSTIDKFSLIIQSLLREEDDKKDKRSIAQEYYLGINEIYEKAFEKELKYLDFSGNLIPKFEE